MARAPESGCRTTPTRIVVFGRDAGQARALAEAIAQSARHNVAYFPGAFDTLKMAIK